MLRACLTRCWKADWWSFAKMRTLLNEFNSSQKGNKSEVKCILSMFVYPESGLQMQINNRRACLVCWQNWLTIRSAQQTDQVIRWYRKLIDRQGDAHIGSMRLHFFSSTKGKPLHLPRMQMCAAIPLHWPHPLKILAFTAWWTIPGRTRKRKINTFPVDQVK